VPRIFYCLCFRWVSRKQGREY